MSNYILSGTVVRKDDSHFEVNGETVTTHDLKRAIKILEKRYNGYLRNPKQIPAESKQNQ